MGNTAIQRTKRENTPKIGQRKINRANPCMDDFPTPSGTLRAAYAEHHNKMSHIQHRKEANARIIKYKQAVKKKTTLDNKILVRKAQLPSVNPGEYDSNFKKFVDKCFIKPSQSQGIAFSSPGYIAFEALSKTSYGAAVIKALLTNPDYDSFLVGQGSTQETRAGDRVILIGAGFPFKSDKKRFETSRQLILPVAILYHELGHTRLFQEQSEGTHDLPHEAAIVKILENPIRMAAGYEPRYTYTNRLQEGSDDKSFETINVLSGKKLPGKRVIDKSEPAKLVSMTDPRGLKPPHRC